MSGNNIETPKMKHRFENFGAIVAGEDPPFLAFVDRQYVRGLGLGESPLWQTPDESIGLLSAPTEVHFAITNKCSVKCPHCYMAAGEKDPGEMDTDRLKSALDVLAEMKVFHVALGGGEALERADLFEIAQYARQIGLVPNLTISGRNLTHEIANNMRVFGQVNVSLDAVGGQYGTFRHNDMFDIADDAIKLLVDASVPTGINCVVGRENFDDIPKLFEYALHRGLNEIEFLRLKPSGRAGPLYEQQRTTFEQNTTLTPMLAQLSQTYKIDAKIDCSFVPMLCYHNPPTELLDAMATYGCQASNVLMGIRSDGTVSGCSFLRDTGLSVFDLKDPARTQAHFHKIRTWADRATQPCRTCHYLDVCKGGCHAVSEYVIGDFDSPDPDCPFVVEYQKRRASNG